MKLLDVSLRLLDIGFYGGRMVVGQPFSHKAIDLAHSLTGIGAIISGPDSPFPLDFSIIVL